MHQPIRTCIGCGKKMLKSELLRIVRTTGQVLRIDPAQKLDGRGAYLCQQAECVQKAKRRKAMTRHLGMPLTGTFERQIQEYLHESAA